MSRSYDDAFVHTAENVRSGVTGFFRLSPAERLQKVSFVLDEAVRIPIFGLRVGLDPLLSVVPFFGSWLGVLLSGYFFWEAWNLRVPWHVYPRMLVNLMVDAVLGMIPVAGVFADAVFKGNVRNRKILMRYATMQSGPGAGSSAEARGTVDVLDRPGR